MAAIALPLPSNVLHGQPQTLEFEKIATFIGSNGSGKSTILKSIFDEKLNGAMYEEYKIICFSSGQNESYSRNFSEYLNSERAKKKALNLDCFYYDKLWPMLLIFLATTGRHDGLVRRFLRQNNYVVENEFDEDVSTSLSFDLKVDKSYINLVNQALEDEAKGESDVITNKAYHRTLHNFIKSLISDSFEFDVPLDQQNIQLNQDLLSRVSFETDENASFESKVMFFTQAADNDFFIVKKSFSLIFKKGEQNLSLGALSDGEYQLLFLYALIDLFDTEHTLFLLDEADSHLHCKNIDRLWSIFKGIDGRIITTTHLLDSISKSGIERLRVIENGQVQPGSSLKHLTDRLNDLSEIRNIKFQALSLFENIVLIDDENDWVQFKLLAIKKLANTDDERRAIESMLDRFVAVKCHSGYEGKDKEVFAGAKKKWLANFTEHLTGQPYNIKNIFLICDRDELPLSRVGTGKCSLLVQGEGGTVDKAKPKIHVMSWRRREIKHYLLSHSAFGKNIDSINDKLDLSKKAILSPRISGDYKTDDTYNEQLATLKSDCVKGILDPYINVAGQGFCIEKVAGYVNKMPNEEISEDIVSMYNYLVGENE